MKRKLSELIRQARVAEAFWDAHPDMTPATLYGKPGLFDPLAEAYAAALPSDQGEPVVLRIKLR